MEMQLSYCYHAAVRRKTPGAAVLKRRVTMVTAELKVLKKIGSTDGPGFDSRASVE
jgi:hypothetical protein